MPFMEKIVSTPNNQVPSKLQSANRKLPAWQLNSKPSSMKVEPTVPLTPVTPTILSCEWSYLGRAGARSKTNPITPPETPPESLDTEAEEMPPNITCESQSKCRAGPKTKAKPVTPTNPSSPQKKPWCKKDDKPNANKAAEKGKPISSTVTPPKSRPQVSRPPLKSGSAKSTSSKEVPKRLVIMDNTRRLMLPAPGSNPYAAISRVYRPSTSGVFDYDLSREEKHGFGHCAVVPMKSVPATELQLLHSGQRSTYLERRYERSPDDKYNYPEATSWRYGWFHRESNPFQVRLPRRE
ncbi:hypothetical protein KR018_004435 [Drosophila ironensis]|nr:hypothetical protein KR018_004435 [Drosophila ironensis]